MKNNVRRIVRICILCALLFCSATAVLLSRPWKSRDERIEYAVQKIVRKRFSVLESYMERSLQQDPESWMSFDDLPSDMVLYRYVNDSLQSWQHQFTVQQDALLPRPGQRMAGMPRRNILSALSFVGERPVYMRLGFNDFILCSRTSSNVRVIGGWRLPKDSRYVISPLTSDSGSVISIDGIPQFRINPLSEVTYPLKAAELAAIGSIFPICFLIFALSLLLYFRRRNIAGLLKSGVSKRIYRSCIITTTVLIVAFVLICVYKVTVYTHISLAVFRVSTLTWPSALVFAALCSALISVPLLLGTVSDYPFSRGGRIVFAVLCGGILFLSTFFLSFSKERQLTAAWAEGITLERDIRLEESLIAMENQIAKDEIIPLLSVTQDAENEVRRHITDVYLRRLPLDFQISVQIGGTVDNLGLDNAAKISADSRFVHAPLQDISCRYVGTFRYFIPFEGLYSIYVTIEKKPEIRNRVFPAGIMMGGPSGIPASYSYAKYSGDDRQLYKGSYPYPTHLGDDMREKFFSSPQSFVRMDSYAHFVNRVSDYEVVIISRRATSRLFVVVVFMFFVLVFFFIMSLLSIRQTKEELSSKNYYKRNIYLVLVLSQIVTMALLALVSVMFVYDRNESNLQSMMSEKLNSIRYMLQSEVRTCHTTSDLSQKEIYLLLGKVSENTSTDINLYSTDGSLIMSTDPGGRIRDMVGGRMNEEAFHRIFHKHKGYCILREKVLGRSYYSMYAPLLGSNGDVIAVFCSPYTENDQLLGENAVTHAVTILTVFFILLILSLWFTERIVDKMFAPLSEMSAKMASADLDSLEYIQYDRQDEITGLVNSYNRMVSELSESTKALAQAERDKAWSAMARQVAHEIKNPLTPMKLQIQRIVRLKSNSDPSWQDKFDEMARILLEHIDLLTETANEFSTFAKLSVEEPVTFFLDRVVAEEIALLGSVPGVSVSYEGPSDIEITGPKPQITRVVFNLLNNAVQATEPSLCGKVVVSVSRTDGGDTVVMKVDDNGPGVSQENRVKLFTPNFTTKSGGTGLGLAISRSVLESCGASISYCTSESLGGACFVVCFRI